MTELLAAENIFFNHGAQRVLEDVSLKFLPGRHYILAGANGAGKSTFFDILSGLRKPLKGHIVMDGRPSADYTPLELARRLALAPQDYRLNFSFTVREVVAMGRRPYLGRWGRLDETDLRAVDAAIKSMDLEELEAKPITALSGGEKQRAVVARALAQETPILLLDEPTAGLDVAHGLKLMEAARRKAREGALVITVTHDLNLAAAFGDDFVFLKKGHLTAAGPREEVFTGEILSRVYDAPCQVRHSDFTGGPIAAFTLEECPC